MNGTDWRAWLAGGPAVFAAAWVSVTLLPDTRWRLSAGGAIAFAEFFLRESLRGGWDVAWRALAEAAVSYLLWIGAFAPGGLGVAFGMARMVVGLDNLATCERQASGELSCYRLLLHHS